MSFNLVQHDKSNSSIPDFSNEYLSICSKFLHLEKSTIALPQRLKTVDPITLIVSGKLIYEILHPKNPKNFSIPSCIVRSLKAVQSSKPFNLLTLFGISMIVNDLQE